MVRLRTQIGLEGLSEVVIRVIEGQKSRPKSAQSFPAHRSSEAARCLVGLALAIADPELKASLDRLATTLGTEVKGAQDVLKAP